jgi:EAL domain-containing protein (putative c-di-GMP-specific phosphodiesterase class I)/CheY-like chemotaxis protein
MDKQLEKPSPVAPFGRRKVRPRVLVSDAKKPVRTFLVEALEKLGFITCECAQACELNAVLDVQATDLVVLGSSAGAMETSEILNLLAIKKFDGKVLLLGPQASPAMANVHKFGKENGLAMLPILATPFSDQNLRDSVATLLRSEAPPNPPVDVAEALGADWLELWYQPKVDARTLSLGGAEAHIRMRHPSWGIVSPAYYIPDDSDPYYRALSEFIISRAIEDWHSFVVQHGHIEIAINLPVSFLQDPEIVRTLCLQIPDHPAFEGLIIKINGTDVIHNLRLVKDVARQLRFHKIALSIDGVGDEWPSLMGIEEFPFVEIKVDKKFVSGCADDRLKQVVCHRILELADDYGSRTVAEGIDSRADFLAVREMGFDRVEGFLFGKPTAAKEFRRTMLGVPLCLPQ